MTKQEKRIANLYEYTNTYKNFKEFGIDWKLSVLTEEESAKKGKALAKRNEKFFCRFQREITDKDTQNCELIETDEQFATFYMTVKSIDLYLNI